MTFPERSRPPRLLGRVLCSPRVRILLLAQALSILGTKTLTYGAMVHLARTGGTQ